MSSWSSRHYAGIDWTPQSTSGVAASVARDEVAPRTTSCLPATAAGHDNGRKPGAVGTVGSPRRLVGVPVGHRAPGLREHEPRRRVTAHPDVRPVADAVAPPQEHADGPRRRRLRRRRAVDLSVRLRVSCLSVPAALSVVRAMALVPLRVARLSLREVRIHSAGFTLRAGGDPHGSTVVGLPVVRLDVRGTLIRSGDLCGLLQRLVGPATERLWLQATDNDLGSGVWAPLLEIIRGVRHGELHLLRGNRCGNPPISLLPPGVTVL